MKIIKKIIAFILIIEMVLSAVPSSLFTYIAKAETATPGPGKYKITLQFQPLNLRSEKYSDVEVTVYGENGKNISLGGDLFPIESESKMETVSKTIDIDWTPSSIFISASHSFLDLNGEKISNRPYAQVEFKFGDGTATYDGMIYSEYDFEHGIRKQAQFCKYSIEGVGGHGPLYYIDADGSQKSKDEGQYECFMGGVFGPISGQIDQNKEYWYVVDQNWPEEQSVIVNGNCHVVLADGVTLKVNDSLFINPNSSLTIYGQKGQTGTLEANGNKLPSSSSFVPIAIDYDATPGIGGCGDITINGGHIIARGGSGAPAIGFTGKSVYETGNITINRGLIEAEGGAIYDGQYREGYFGGTGIGGACKNIVINGGKITAKGRIGIGGSFEKIEINNGDITATGCLSGAGIGGDNCGDILITGGTVSASMLDMYEGYSCVGSAIGSAGDKKQAGITKITGSNTKVTAVSYGRGAGIGGSSGVTNSNSGGEANKIYIGDEGAKDGPTVIAISKLGAGIGSGGSDTGLNRSDGARGGDIVINSGNVYAISACGGAGIGGGNRGSAGTVTINGGYTYAQGGGAHVNAIDWNDVGDTRGTIGSMEYLSSMIDDKLANIVINWMFSENLSGAGIGGGSGGSAGTIHINGGIVEALSGYLLETAVGKGYEGEKTNSDISLYQNAKVTYGNYNNDITEIDIKGIAEASVPMDIRIGKVMNNAYALIEPGKSMIVFDPGKDDAGNAMKIDGSLPDSVEVVSEMKVERPEDPVHKSEENDGDYIFDDWYEDEAHTKPFDFDTPISTGVTIYANWVKAYPVIIEKKWDESVDTTKIPDSIEISYEDRYKIGENEKVRTGSITLSKNDTDATKNWKEKLYVTETSIITLSEKYIKGFKPTKQWQLSYQYIDAYGTHTVNYESEDNNRTIVFDVNESDYFKDYFLRNKVSRITNIDYYPWITVTNGTNIVSNKFNAQIKWDPDDENTPKPENIAIGLLKYDTSSSKWVIEASQIVNQNDNWKTSFTVSSPEGTEYIVRELYKENSGDSEYKIAFEGSDEEKRIDSSVTKTPAVYGDMEYDVTYEEDYDNTTVITNHSRKFDFEVIWKNPEDYNPYNEITIVLQYNDNGNWIDVDSTVIKRAPSGSPAGTPYKNVTITTDSDGNVHMNGTLNGGWYKGNVTDGKYRIREIANKDGDDPDSGEIIYNHTDTESGTPPAGHDRGEMILHDESVVGRETHTYDVNYNVDDNDKTIITNTQKGSFSVKKVWNSEYYPATLDVVLLEHMYNSETGKYYWKVIEEKTLKEVDNCDWEYKFDTIQSGRGDWDNKYCVQELDADGNIIMDSDTSSFYRSSISNTDVYDKNGNLMNKKEEFSITKNIDGKDKKLYFRPEYDIDVANGKVTITNNLRNGVTVTKVWNGSEDVGKPDSIKVVLQKKNDFGIWENVKDPVELTSTNNYKTSFLVDLTKKSGAGYNFNDYYRIREVERIENEGAADQTVKVVYNSNDLDKPEDYKNSVTYNVGGNDVSYDVKYEIKENGDTVITNSNNEKLITIKKTWDIDLENNDKPNSIEVIIQAKNGDKWENAGIVELDDTHSWTASKALPQTRKNGDKEEKIEYRVRELREENALSDLMNGVKSQIEAGKAQYDSWISTLKNDGKAYWDQLPKEIRDAADEGYDSLIDELNTTPENLYSKLMEQFAYASVENRIVYDENDAEAKDIDEDDKNKEPNKVTYHVEPKTSAVYGNIEAHVTKYLVSYDQSEDTYTINNQAILEIDVIKRWLGINVDEEDMPDSVWVVLMYQPKAGQDGNIPTPSDGNVIEYEIPVINPIEGGNDPISIISQLALGIDLGMFSEALHIPKLAIARVTKDDDWTKKFVVSKYTFGITTEFKGAELGSEIIRQIIKYLTGFDILVSYNPFGGFISIPTKAIKTLAGLENPSDLFDLSKLAGAAKTKAESLTMDDIMNFGPSTLLDDWHLMANVINVKFAFDGRDVPGEINGVKVWENDTVDKRPDTLIIKATNVNDATDVKTVTLNKSDFGSSNQWNWRITGTDDSVEYTYSEEYPEGFANKDKYQLVVSGCTLTNIWTSNSDTKVTISGRKTWDDNNNANGKRPDTITVRLYADGEEVASVKTSKAADWKWHFANQPKNNPDGTVIKYTISEDSVENYESTVNGYNITNKCDTTTIGKTQVNVRKVWVDDNNKDGIRPSSITVKLYADGTEVTGKTLELKDSNNWTGSFSELPVKNETTGRNIEYTVRETKTTVITGTDGDGTYSYSYEGNAKKGYTIYNYHTPKVTWSGEKIWDDNNNANGKRPSRVTIRLLCDGVEVPGQVKTVTATDNWEWTFDNLPGKVDGKLVTYSIREDAVDNYKSNIDADYANNKFTVTNTYNAGMTQVDVQKIWKDNDNEDGLRPENVKIWLYADGKKTDKPVTLSAAVDWKGSFTDLEIYSNSVSPRRIQYTVREELTEVITGTDSATTYSYTVSGDAKRGYTITNSHVSVKTSVSGTKTWDDHLNILGKRPESITVRLKADGVEVASKKITSSDGWKWNFTDLPLVKNGQRVKYTVSEDIVENYTSTVSGYDITNKYSSGKTQVNVTKIWKDDNNKEGIRPLSVSVKLYSNGVDTSKVITLTEDNEWQGSFLDLPLKDATGKSISYSIREVMTDVITGVDGDSTYSSVISGNAQSGFTITNTHSTSLITLQGSKMWNFGNVKEEDRPTEIEVYLKEDGQTLLTADRSGMEHRKAKKENGWKWSFEDLPRRKNGKEVKYTVVEYAMDGYISTINGNTILNTSAPDRTQVNVTKVWNDDDDADGIRPESVTVKLFANSVETSRKLVLTEENNWSGSFKDLAIKDEDENPITYSVEEVMTGVITGIDGPMTYKTETSVEGDKNRDFTITNTHTPTKITIEGNKTWSDSLNVHGKRPNSITIRLYGDGKEVAVKTVTKEDDWKWTFKVNKNNKGREIAYTISEDPVLNYFSEVDGFNVKNTYTNIDITNRERYKITYQLNGGYYNGSTLDIEEYYYPGTVITIHDAPLRSGYEFTYWKGSEYRPGDSYCVTGDHVFVAQWRDTDENHNEYVPPSDPLDKVNENKFGNGKRQGPYTGDDTNIILLLIVLALSIGTIIYCINRMNVRRKREE